MVTAGAQRVGTEACTVGLAKETMRDRQDRRTRHV